MDMELDTSNDAESNFFLSQQSLEFPASVWDFSSRPPSHPRHSRDAPAPGAADKDSIDNVSSGSAEAPSGSNKRKACDELTEESLGSPEEINEDGEEEASLRSLLLAQVGRSKSENKKKKKVHEDNDNETKEEEVTTENAQMKDSKKKESGNDKVLNVSDQKENKPVVPKQKSKKLKGKEKVQKLKSTAGNQKVKVKPRVKQVKISEAEQKKYFPNLFASKKVVVNFSGDDSESDSDQNDSPCDTEIQKPVKDNLFGLDLDSFLKQARNSSQAEVNPKLSGKLDDKLNHLKVTKKIAMTPQLKAKASNLTLEDKKKLISAKIRYEIRIFYELFKTIAMFQPPFEDQTIGISKIEGNFSKETN